MNLGDLLKQAMELEKMQVMLYKGLEKKFSFSKEISQFWSGMAKDENGHYEHIVKMYNQFGPEQLSGEVDNNLYDAVCKGLRELKPSRLKDVADLHDACQLAHEIENYETEAVFKFVQTKLKNDSSRLEISVLILGHLDKLASFSDKFNSINEKRRIKAIT